MQILKGRGGPIAAPSFTTVPALLICSPYPSRWASRGVKTPGARVGLDALARLHLVDTQSLHNPAMNWQ